MTCGIQDLERFLLLEEEAEVLAYAADLERLSGQLLQDPFSRFIPVLPSVLELLLAVHVDVYGHFLLLRSRYSPDYGYHDILLAGS